MKKGEHNMGLFSKMFGTRSDREVKALTPIVNKIESLEEEYKALTDAQLQAALTALAGSAGGQ